MDGGGVASGGLRELIPCIARTAVAVGVDGIFMEVQRIVYASYDSLVVLKKILVISGSAFYRVTLSI